METENTTRKNPSRETCQKIIKRILVTEVLEKGCNEHFRQASDFMGYFQSLYPASDALTKQVQRAIKAMDMPRDERDRKSTRLNSSHWNKSRMPSSA